MIGIKRKLHVLPMYRHNLGAGESLSTYYVFHSKSTSITFLYSKCICKYMFTFV